MTTPNGALVLTLSRRPGPPWWWDDIDRAALGCRIGHEVIVLDGPRPDGPWSRGFFPMLWRCCGALRMARRERYRFLITFECDWTSFIVAAVQTLLFLRRPRHVIVQFIMRERSAALASRLKYAVMTSIFSSVELCVCSSRAEAEYYQQAFGWPARKVGYMPLHTDPGFLARRTGREIPMVVAAGRTFRDYPALLEAFATIDVPLTIVASPGSLPAGPLPANVTVRHDIPITELIDLIARCMFVVLPLEERQISIGQSVLVEAMAMGKAVIATRVNGTIDYIEHMQTGILVPPRDPAAIREAVLLLARDRALRDRLGAAAHSQVLSAHLPSHYAEGVATLLRGR